MLFFQNRDMSINPGVQGLVKHRETSKKYPNLYPDPNQAIALKHQQLLQG
jgi:hypothetical protein